MPMATDLSGTALALDSATAVQDPKRKADQFARMVMPGALRKQIFYIKIEMSDGRSDTKHDPNFPWVEQFTAIREGFEPGFRNINSVDPSGAEVQGVSEDQGYIMTFHGTPGGSVAVDEQNMSILSEVQAQMQEDNFGISLPRGIQWEFRLHEVILTDGPQSRERVQEHAEQQRARAEEKSFSKQEAFFERLLGMIQAKGGQPVVNAKEVFQQEMAPSIDLSPEQKAAAEAYGDPTDDTQVENVPVEDMKVKARGPESSHSDGRKEVMLKKMEKARAARAKRKGGEQ
jgi:hypothetical protein